MAGPVRQPIDLDRLQGYIRGHVAEIKTPIKIRQFGHGQSNPTYELTDANEKRFVLRKKPPGALVSKTAHNVEREFRVLRALQQTDVPVPKVYCLCDDTSIVGSVFYIMEFLDGRIITQPSLPGISSADRTRIWRSAMETLAKIHRVDFKAIGLGSFKRPDSFYNRQIKTFKTLSRSQAQAVDKDSSVSVGDLPHFSDMASFLEDKHNQVDDRVTLIHGDYLINNLIFHKTEFYVIGVLDWEMTTVGHPLSDLANLTAPYVSATSPTLVGAFDDAMAFRPGATPGLPTREQCMKWYADESKWDPTGDLAWGDAFSAFRTAVVIQGIAARYALRQNSNPQAASFAAKVVPNSKWAWDLVERVKRSRNAAGSRLQRSNKI